MTFTRETTYRLTFNSLKSIEGSEEVSTKWFSNKEEVLSKAPSGSFTLIERTINKWKMPATSMEMRDCIKNGNKYWLDLNETIATTQLNR